MKSVFLMICILTILAAAGCRPLTPEPRNLIPDAMPENFAGLSETGTPMPAGEWWPSFGCQELNTLIERALGNNFSLREYWARLEQAKQAAFQEHSALFPEISISAGASNSRSRDDLATATSDLLSIGPSASYEIDLWGKINANVKASDLETAAARLDLETASMTVAAEIATFWVDLAAAKKELELINQQLSTNNTIVDLLELRFKNSLSSALDVLQQREIAARTAAQAPPIETRIHQLSNSIAILGGQPPGTIPPQPGLCEVRMPELPKIGLPAALLHLRPDIKAAGIRLMASDWETEAAKAERLPSFYLTGSFLFRDNALDMLFRNWSLTLASTIAATVFDKGKTDAEIDKKKAITAERLATYEKTVFNALMEVDNALAAEHWQSRYLSFLEAELDAAKAAMREAGKRYQNGVYSFIPFLSEQNNVQELERRILKEKASLFKYRITLYRALGGNWTKSLTQKTKPIGDS